MARKERIMGIGGHNLGAPWKIGRGGRTIRSFYLKPRTVCQVFAHAGAPDLWDEDDDATVRLLAKAPELLRVCKSFLSCGGAGSLSRETAETEARALIANVDGKGAGR